MSVRRTALAGVILLALAGCGTDSKAADPASAPAAPTSTQPTAAASAQPEAKVREKVVLDAQGGGAGKGLCTLFTAAELSTRLGIELGEGEIAAPLDSGCQWTGKSQSGNVLVQRVPASFWSEPTTRKNYKPLTGVGEKAYTSPGMFDGDWDAAARHGNYMTIASLDGPNANAATALATLKETLARG